MIVIQTFSSVHMYESLVNHSGFINIIVTIKVEKHHMPQIDWKLWLGCVVKCG
jgi:hypothetical protein